MRLKFTTALLLAVIAPAMFGGSIPGITATTIPSPPSFSDQVTGPDGNIWFTAWKENAIGRITPGPNFTLFPLPTPNSTPISIAAGVDGNLWFTEQAGNVGRITTSGAIKEFPVGAAGDFLEPIVAVGDGSLWILNRPRQTSATPPNSKLVRMTTTGQQTSYDLGTHDSFEAMAAGPDGNVWIYDIDKNAILKITTKDGKVASTFTMPKPSASNFQSHFVLGPDGNLWMTHGDSFIARIKMDGTITEYSVPTAGGKPTGLNVGADGNLWFTEYNGKVGQLILSSATDSGQATINETDSILRTSAITMVSLPGKVPTSASSTFPISTEGTVHAQEDDPCAEQTKIVTFTENNEVFEVKITLPPLPCADLRVTAQIQITAPRTSGSFTTQSSSVNCFVANNGPSTATAVAVTCKSTGGLILSSAKVSGTGDCTFNSTTGGYVLRAGALAKGQDCTLAAGFDPSMTEKNVLTAMASSETIDPNMSNNAYLYALNENLKVIAVEPFNPNPVPSPLFRGH